MGKNTWSRPDREALNRVLANNKSNLEGIVLRLAWKQGLSREEIRQLTWNDVSFSSGQLILPDRLIPMEAETQACLQERYDFRGGVSPFVVISERCRRQILPESVSRLARGALDQEGLKDVSLSDLRRDFIICQLEEHDWQYVSRITGVEAAALNLHFSKHLREKKVSTRIRREEPAQIDEFSLWKLVQTERTTPAGVTLWLTWQLGLRLEEIVALKWDQVDLEQGSLHMPDRTVSLTSGVHSVLKDLRAASPDSVYVLTAPRSGQPYDRVRLSKLVRMLLIRAGMDNVTLRDLRLDCAARTGGEDQVMAYLRKHQSVTRNQVMELLGVSKTAAYTRLKQMEKRGKLTQVGARYYLKGNVVPPERQAEAILEYLAKEGFAYRQDIARLLRIDPGQCRPILQKMVAAGQIIQKRQRYELKRGE